MSGLLSCFRSTLPFLCLPFFVSFLFLYSTQPSSACAAMGTARRLFNPVMGKSGTKRHRLFLRDTYSTTWSCLVRDSLARCYCPTRLRRLPACLSACLRACQPACLLLQGCVPATYSWGQLGRKCRDICSVPVTREECRCRVTCSAGSRGMSAFGSCCCCC